MGCTEKSQDPNTTREVISLEHSQIQIEYPTVVTLKNTDSGNRYDYWVKITWVKGSDVFLASYSYYFVDKEGKYWSQSYVRIDPFSVDLDDHKVSQFSHYFLGPTWFTDKKGQFDGGSIHLKFYGYNQDKDSFEKEIVIKTNAR
jgi:hypothetical protein